jgi:hypothetical protein
MAILGDACSMFRGQTDAGRMIMSVVWQVAAAVLAATNAATSSHIASKQFDLAQQYYRISRNWRDWYNSGYIPLEDKEVAEVKADVKATPYYDIAVGRALALAKSSLKGRGLAEIQCYSQYETGAVSYRLKRATEEMARIYSVSMAQGYRNERARVDALSDFMWKKKEQVVARGRDMMSRNVIYGQFAGQIYGSLSKQAATAAQGYMRFLGYSLERMNTRYPERIGHRKITGEVNGQSEDARDERAYF